MGNKSRGVGVEGVGVGKGGGGWVRVIVRDIYGWKKDGEVAGKEGA